MNTMSRTLALFLSASLAYGPIAAMAEAQDTATTQPARRGIWVRKPAPSTTTTTSGGWDRFVKRTQTTEATPSNSNTGSSTNTGNSGTNSGSNGTVTNPGEVTPPSGSQNPAPSVTPSDLMAASADNGQVVNLSWVDNSTAESMFEITRETMVSGNYGASLVRTVAPNTTSYLDRPGVGQHRYRIRALDAAGGSALTTWSMVSVLEVAPNMPSGLQAADMRNGRDAWIAWTDTNQNETEFMITRERRSGTTWVETVSMSVPANTTSFVDSAGVGTFRYQIKAVNAAGSSLPTHWLAPTIADVAPAAPGDIAAADLGNRTQVLVTWSDNSNNESGFQVERETNTSGSWGSPLVLSAEMNATSLIDAPGLGLYRYRIRSSNGVGTSSYSAWSQVAVNEIAPASPGNVTATDLGNRSQARVQWDDNSDNESGFIVVRETLSGGNWGSALNINAAANATSVIDSPGMGTYRYRVMATNVAGNSAATSNVQVAVVEIAPGAPSSLASASAGNGSQVNLSWVDNSNNETSFQIVRETQSGSTFGSAVNMNAAANAVAMTDAPGQGTFRYRMRAVNTAGNSAYTAWSQVTVSAPAPTAPSAPSSLAVVNNDDGTASISWTDNANNETGFQVERSPAFVSAMAVGANVTTMVDDAGAGAFMYRVRAVNGGGNSSWSNWVSVSVTDTPPGGGGGTGGTGGGGGSGGGGSGGTETGWTTYALASDAREVYVSSTAGNNANAGTASAPVRSLAAGYALLRHGYPDRLKLKRGDVWDEALPSWKKGGRSAEQPMVVEAYGDESLARPLLRTGTNSGFRREPGGGAPASVDNLAIMNVHFWAHTAVSSADVGIWWLGPGMNIRIEDCKIENYGFGMTLQGYTGTMTNFTIHRSIIVDSHSNGSHSSGLYASKYDGLTMTECVLDKNGYKAGTAANPTMFNHNAYFDILGDNLVFSRNVVCDASSHGVQLRPGAVAEDNLFMKNPIALQIGFGGTDAGADDNPQHDQMAYVRRNVFIDGRDIDANNPRGWAIIAEWLRGGEIVDNLALNGGGGYRKALIVSDTGGGSTSGGVQNVTIARNIWYNWGGDFQFDGNSSELRNVTFSSNIVHESAALAPVFLHEFATTTAMVTSSNNTVWTASGQSGWGEIAGGSKSFTQWKSAVGDTTSTAAQSTFPNPNVTINSYSTAKGLTPSYDAFMARVREQRKGNWDVRYEADDVGTWFRAQFGR